MNHLVIVINKECNLDDAASLMKVCFVNAYLSKEKEQDILVIPTYQGTCLGYARTAANFLGNTIRAYGLREDGTKFSLLRDKELLDEPELVGKR